MIPAACRILPVFKKVNTIKLAKVMETVDDREPCISGARCLDYFGGQAHSNTNGSPSVSEDDSKGNN